MTLDRNAIVLKNLKCPAATGNITEGLRERLTKSSTKNRGKPLIRLELLLPKLALDKPRLISSFVKRITKV